MKRLFNVVALALLATVMMTACGDGYKTTKGGLKYKFIENHKDAQQLQLGDIVVGTCTLRLGDSIIDKLETPDRILMVTEPSFPGHLSEGLLLMHLGDKAILGVAADSLAKRGMPLPPIYKEGTDTRLWYEIQVTDIITKEEFKQEQDNFMANRKQRLADEKVALSQYVAEHNLNVTPDEDGLYVVVTKKGKGQKVEIGRDVKINYTGRLLDGRVFDTSVESVAKENGLYKEGAAYQPLSYRVGEQRFIQGWEKGVINQTEGSKVTLIIPSEMGYGPNQVGPIPPDSPLIFDIEIVSVK